MSIAKMTREELVALIDERIAAALAPKPVAPPALRPVSSLSPIEHNAVVDMVAAGRYGEALSLLQRYGAKCSPEDVRPRDRALARANAASGANVPDSPHLPGWHALLSTVRPFSQRADAETEAERGAREAVAQIVAALAGQIPASVARSLDASTYHPSKARALASVLGAWRWSLSPADVPNAAHGIERAIAAGWLTTGPNLPADAWTTSAAA